ncbi:glycoside hydrolase family 5 protein [Apiospora arundinis]
MWKPALSLKAATLAQGVMSRHIQWAGVNLFGFANDVSIFGSAYNTFESSNCNASYASYPYADPVSHYEDWHQLGFNLFRAAIAWQHAQEDLGGPLNETTLRGVYSLVQAATEDGGQVILDIHNYARWYCAVIGQPELSFLNPTIQVTNDHFADLWVKLATRYQNNTNIIFQLMNEPHDLDIVKWGNTNQEAINAIRNVTSAHKILVSGTQFARLTNWMASSSTGIGPGLIQDPANNTLYDFHQYFDDLGGAYGLCEPWGAFLKAFDEVTALLRAAGYRAMLTDHVIGRPLKFNSLP